MRGSPLTVWSDGLLALALSRGTGALRSRHVREIQNLAGVLWCRWWCNGSASYGWMSNQTMSRAILLAAAGALGGFIGGYLVGRRLS